VNEPAGKVLLESVMIVVIPILTNDHAGRSLDLVFAVVCQWQQKYSEYEVKVWDSNARSHMIGSQLTIPSTLCDKVDEFHSVC
jgi:hypothetical protein